MNNRIRSVSVLILAIVMTASCSHIIDAPTSIPPAESISLPTPASTLPELVHDLLSDNMAVRLVSIYKLYEFGNEATVAIPALISNLYVDDFDVRIAAIIELGRLGRNSKSAVPDLVNVLHNDSSIHANIAAADALGLVGDRSVVPELAIALFKENPYQSFDVAISSAVSIAKITGEKFSDFDSKTGYILDKNGIPLIVIDARNWWLETGQYKKWTGE